MDLGAVMVELAVRLDTIDGLRVYDHPVDNAQAPAAIVTYPGTLAFDKTYQRGMDQLDPSVVALVGHVNTKAARNTMAAYCRGSGPQSFKEVLEAAEPAYESFDSLRVVSIDFDMISLAGVEYLAATFTLDISGQGD